VTTAAADLAERRELAVLTAKLAGQRLLSLRGSDLAAENKSSASDWVSNADRMVEQLVVQHLAAARPDDGILGEENASRPSKTGWTWVIDPLDGTTNYLRGYPSWSVSIAGDFDGETRVGAVHDPTASLMYAAARGQGATLNDRRIRVSTCTELARAIVGTGFSYQAKHRARQAETLAVILGKTADIRRGGSAALELCRVADGSLDGFYEDDLHYWDWAAGAVIVQEAGGAVTRLAGDSVAGLAAAPTAILPALLEACGGQSSAECR
jgi:myo-inositol-1(or 4)-monophosphatase